MQQTATPSISSTLRSSPSRVFTTCSCARPSNRPLEPHAEGTAQPVKEPPDEEDHLPQTLKRQATSAAAVPAKTSTSRGTLDELAERLGRFHESARALASCLQKQDVSRKTDQSMIEAATCMFHKLLGEVRDDLDRVTSQSQGGPHAEIKQSKQRCSRTAILEENPRPRCEQQSGKSVHQTSTETALPQSSAGIPEQAIEDYPRKELELSVPQKKPGEWKHDFKMSTFTMTILNLLFTEAEQKGKIRHFRMCIGPGSDGPSADKLSLDLKFNP